MCQLKVSEKIADMKINATIEYTMQRRLYSTLSHSRVDTLVMHEKV